MLLIRIADNLRLSPLGDRCRSERPVPDSPGMCAVRFNARQCDSYPVGSCSTPTLLRIARKLCSALFDTYPGLLLGAPYMRIRLYPGWIIEGSSLDEHDPAVRVAPSGDG